MHPRGGFPHISLITLGLIASLFSLGHLSEVIGSLIATRVLIRIFPETIGFFFSVSASRNCHARFACGFTRCLAIISLGGWVYVLGTAAARSMIFAVTVFAVGTAAYMARARVRREWPFQAEDAERQISQPVTIGKGFFHSG